MIYIISGIAIIGTTMYVGTVMYFKNFINKIKNTNDRYIFDSLSRWE